MVNAQMHTHNTCIHSDSECIGEMCVCMCVCVYVCMCVFADLHVSLLGVCTCKVGY